MYGPQSKYVMLALGGAAVGVAALLTYLARHYALPPLSIALLGALAAVRPGAREYGARSARGARAGV
jgi:hypothetical protein